MKRIVIIVISMVAWIYTYAQDIPSYPLDTIDGKIYYRYKVERSIGLYRISKNFGVSQEEILKANPKVQQDGLRYDEEILIPAKGMRTAQGEKGEIKQDGEEKMEKKAKRIIRTSKPRIIWKKEVMEEDSMAVDSTLVDSTRVENMTVDSTDVIRIAALLPLQADALERDKSIDRFYDYYAGMLMAVNEVQTTGQRVEVYTYDIGKSTQKIDALMADSNWMRVDAMVGPAFGQQVAIAQKVSNRDSSWLLVPFLPQVKDIAQYPYMLKFNPSHEVVADTVGRYLAQYGDSINCVVFDVVGDGLPSSISQLHKALKKYQIPTTKATLRAILSDSLDGIFMEGKENIIIFNTERYGNLQSAMPHLLKASGQYRITLFSQYSWQNEKIILPQLYTTVFIEDPVVTTAYDSVYAQYFAHEPASTQPRYDLLGYDQTRQLLYMLQMPSDSIRGEVWHGLQSTIQYVAVSERGGMENKLVHIIRK